MMEQKREFYLSGIASFAVYLVVCIAILLYINTPKPKKFDVASKVTVLELELISTKSNELKVAKKSMKQEAIVKKATSRSHKQKADFKSLFANVSTKSVKVEKKRVNTVTKSLDPSRFKSKFEKQKKSDNVSVSKILNDVKTTTNRPTNMASKKGKEHEYFSKIKEILWQRWNPRLLNEGLEVKVLVMITNNGKFDYRIMKYSNEERFDQSLKEFLNTQINEIFPPHDIGSKVDIIINFKSEG